MAIGRHRRTLAALALLAACWLTVRSATPPRTTTVSVLVAAHDLPAGTTIASGDERRATWLAGSQPQGALEEAAGQVLGAPMRAGEAFTSARVLGRGLLSGEPAEMEAFPVRLSDSQTGTLVAAGDRVDVLVADSGSGDGTTEMDGTDDGVSSAAIDGTNTDSKDDTQSTQTSTQASTVGPDAPASPTSGASATPTIPPTPANPIPNSDATSTDGHSSRATRLVTGATVLAVGDPSGSDSSSGSSGGGLSGLGRLGGSGDGSAAADSDANGLLVLAVTSAQAAELASAQAAGYLAIAILPRSGG